MSLSLGIALYAAIVSTCSAAVAVMAYRAGGPRLQVAAGGFFTATLAVAVVQVTNSGRADISVDSFTFADVLEYEEWLPEISQVDLPFRLAGHSTNLFQFSFGDNIPRPPGDTGVVTLPYRVRVRAAGKTVERRGQMEWITATTNKRVET